MIDKIVWEKFRRYCAVNAFKISGKIQLLLEDEMERGPKTKNLLDMFQEIMEKQGSKEDIEKEEMNIYGEESKDLNDLPEQKEEVHEESKPALEVYESKVKSDVEEAVNSDMNEPKTEIIDYEDSDADVEDSEQIELDNPKMIMPGVKVPTIDELKIKKRLDLK